MEQHDCPFIDTTVAHDVSFSTVHWEFRNDARELQTRMVVEGEDREALGLGLEALRDHPNLEQFDLQKRWGDTARIRTSIQETDAMGRIRAHDGFITGPFHIDDGSERWHVGFDTGADADKTLSALERNNEFDVKSREEYVSPMESTGQLRAGLELLQDCQRLTDVERETLETAVEHGYFSTPREMSLADLADELGVSSAAVSKNLRRGQEKVVSNVMETLAAVDE